VKSWEDGARQQEALMKALGIAIAFAAAAACGPAAATTYVFETTLSGLNEVPANASPGTGFATLIWDTDAHTAQLDFTYSGLLGTALDAHIHAPTAAPNAGNIGIATPPQFGGLFTTGLTAGAFSHLFATNAASFYQPSFVTNFGGGTVTGAEAALLNALQTERAYLNIHTTAFPPGEIRGFFAAVPEPQAWALMLLGFGLAGTAVRSRRGRLASVRA
jgi:hypothetical protein